MNRTTCTISVYLSLNAISITLYHAIEIPSSSIPHTVFLSSILPWLTRQRHQFWETATPQLHTRMNSSAHFHCLINITATLKCSTKKRTKSTTHLAIHPQLPANGRNKSTKKDPPKTLQTVFRRDSANQKIYHKSSSSNAASLQFSTSIIHLILCRAPFFLLRSYAFNEHTLPDT